MIRKCSVEVGVWKLGGQVVYEKAMEVQRAVAEAVKGGSSPWPGGVVLVLEHSPVYTIGIRTKGYGEEDEAKLRGLGADFRRTNRGGLITFHGPGQLVAYPVLNLRLWRPSVRWYVDRLEETVITACQALGVPAHRSPPHPGIWSGSDKLCSVGVHASRYVTSHGIALNCNTDLNWFKHIVPCGIQDRGVTSLTALASRPLTVDHALPHFIEAFQKQFNCRLLDLSTTSPPDWLPT